MCTITVQEVLATATRYTKEMRDKIIGWKDTMESVVTILNNTVLKATEKKKQLKVAKRINL